MGDAGETAIPRHHVKELAGFFAAHDRWLFGHACVRTQGDRELSADLVQDTFEAAAMAWSVLREHPGDRQRAWLLGTLAHIPVRPPGPGPFGADGPLMDYIAEAITVPEPDPAEMAELGARIAAGRRADASIAGGGEALNAEERADLSRAAELGRQARTRPATCRSRESPIARPRPSPRSSWRSAGSPESWAASPRPRSWPPSSARPRTNAAPARTDRSPAAYAQVAGMAPEYRPAQASGPRVRFAGRADPC